MAECSGCGNALNANERFCSNCGLDTQATAQQTAVQQTVPQQTAVQSAAPQAAYMPPATQAAGTRGRGGDPIARAAMGLGIGGGLLGILWGSLGPYLSLKFPASIGWFDGATNPYLTGIEPVILLVIGLALSLLAVLGAAVATKAIIVTRVLLLVCGLGGFLLGPSWLLPGTLLLAGAGLAIAARSPEK